MNRNQIIKLLLFLNNCFLVSNIKIEKCSFWNKISKCFRISGGNNTHCYETKLNGTFCCSDTLNFNDFSIIENSEILNLEKCISYGEDEHDIFLQKLFVLSVGLLICIVIGIIIFYCRTHNCACGKQDGLVVLAVEDVQTSPTHSKLESPKNYIFTKKKNLNCHLKKKS